MTSFQISGATTRPPEALKTLEPSQLRALWRSGAEAALFDVREESDFSFSHPFFAVSLPLSQIETRIYALAPRLGAPIVVYDNGEGLAERALPRIRALGYEDVRLLAGGLAAYAAVGETFRDVNVPSKAFGELVEAIRHTPSLSADEAKALIETEDDLVVLDARRFEEYRTMSIPRGRSVPGAELALRAREIVASPQTKIIVNCAGRTRSIVGAQTLVNAGLPNPVYALRNGAIGWTLAGHQVERGRTDRETLRPARTLEAARAAAAQWARRVGVRVIDAAVLEQWREEAHERTLYRLDVRSPEEYAAGHPHGFVSAPGGQLVQATDEWIGVRGSRIALYDDDGVRARMTASWLIQMGWDAAVIGDGQIEAREKSPPLSWPLPLVGDIGEIPVEELATGGGDFTILALARSPAYAARRIPGAHFVLASRFGEDLARAPGAGPLVLTSADGVEAWFAYGEAKAALSRAAPGREALVLKGGDRAWGESGRAFESGAATARWLSPPDDVYKRPYEGTDNTTEAMQAYIDWELRLVAQLANDGVSNFHVV